jgi:hypothetical protein
MFEFTNGRNKKVGAWLKIILFGSFDWNFEFVWDLDIVFGI